VPASSATIGPIDRIFTRIGASDDLARGQSTFMVEMTEAAHILRNATSNSLVLMDEVGRGTSTYDGLSLAWACAEHLVENNHAMCLFATHYFELTDMAERHASVRNVHLDAVEHEGKIIFMHSIKTGATDRSYGLQVAELAGLPDIALNYARQRLAALEAQSEQPAIGIDNKPSYHPSITGTAPSATIQCPATLPVAQLELFSPGEAVKDYLTRLDVDALSAREALQHLYAMIDMLDPDASV